MLFSNIKSKIVLTISAIASIALLSLAVAFVSQYTEEKLALEDSDKYMSMIFNMQNFYAQEIVSHAVQNKIKIEKDYKKAGIAIPSPPTFMLELLKYLNSRYEDINFNLYSEHPFYKRIGGGPRDQFERDVLSYFKNSGTSEFYIVEKKESGRYLRHARAIRMQEGCVECHNTHPDSPVRTWKVGDLRGVQSLIIKLPGFTFITNGHLNPLIISAIALYLLAVIFGFLLFFTIQKLRHERKQAKIIKEQNDQIISAKATLELSANIDLVTKLPNRRSFYNFVKQRITEAHQQANGFSIMIIDLDHFKNVNDQYGHKVGDALLKTVGERLQNLIGKHDMVARLGGDEFSLYFHDLTDIKEIIAKSEEVSRVFEEPINADNVLVGTTINIGASQYPIDGDTADIIISNAGLALNKAKMEENQIYWFFDKEMQNKIRHDDIMECDLKAAISNNGLDIFYQPKVCLKTGELDGFEALIRWPHANQGFISPEDFLPIAEERGLIIPVGRYAARRIGENIATWLGKKMLRGRIAVNIHSHQLKSIEEMKHLMEIFEEYHIPPEHLTLEITEGCVMGHGSENSIEILKQLSDKGIKISLDDFGTGYASLTHLKSLPVQEVKIDKSFLKDITNNKESEAIVYAIIDLSRKIGLEVVAEGIETQEQLQMVKNMGCHVGQGFIFSPPSMMIVANGLLSLPNLFKDIVLQDQENQVVPYETLSNKM